MHISIYPKEQYPECLLLVGGSGDTSEGFLPLVHLLSQKIPTTNICTFTFSSKSKTDSILDIQAKELVEIIEKLSNELRYKSINIFSTSMGAYATIKLLSSNKYANLIDKVIFFDPADYYLSAKFGDSSDVTWSGSQPYQPTKVVVSNELMNVTGKVKISVVHLTLRNYGDSGYLMNDFQSRGDDNPAGYPRLSTDMVKHLYNKIPKVNQDSYVELPGVPHAIFRDGNISNNLIITVDTVVQLL